MRSGLCGLLVLCVALRLMAWLITPAIPLLVVLLLLVGGLYFLCGRQG
jgi:hypothetical protein